MVDPVVGAAVSSFSFGSFSLVPSRHLLLDGETPVRLGSRAFAILVALVERRGELVSKDALISRAWPATYVVEGNLKLQVAGLRRALGDGQNGRRYIVTSPGQGYRFVAAVSVGDDSAFKIKLTPSKTKHNLPVQLTRLIGRAGVVGTLVEQVSMQRLLTIVGAGGIGKTAVAVNVAEELMPAYEHGVWLVDFAAVTDQRLLPITLALALGLEVRPDIPFPDMAVAFSDKQMLLVLDNCEHVIEAAASLANEILKGSRRVHILATSREPLRAHGEFIHRLLPLAVPAVSDSLTGAEALRFPAVQLFVERAAANLNDFELTDADAPSAGDICRKLDGVPLAIELAAARVSTFGVRGLAARLDDRLRFFTGGRTVALRHRNIVAALDWSHQLLSPEERTIFRRLAVFAGGFTEAAARTVMAGSGVSPLDIGEIVAELVAKSMVSADVSGGDVRFHLLETIRAYAVTKLAESGEADKLARCHATYFLGLLQDPGNSRIADDFAAAHAPEIDNIRAALSWAFAPAGDEQVAVALAAASAPLWVGHRKQLLKATPGPNDTTESAGSSGAMPVDADPAVAERRQLTVMSCHIAGSTSLSARPDSEDMRFTIRAYQEAYSGVVARYDGFVAKFTDDRFLAYFGYPRAHEDDAERAVRAALEIVEAVGKIETPAREKLCVRIGIATGLVVVGYLIGNGSAREQAVVGGTPNLAAQLQGLAEPGNIVVASSTRRLLGALFRLRLLDQQHLNGLAEPNEAWAVDGIAASGSRFEAATRGGLTPLVGREQEIELLLNRWALAQEGEGQVVLLSGEPGIGKSRTLSALRDRLEVQGAQSLRFQCSPYYVNSAFWPSIDNFERALKFGRDERPESKLDKLEALMIGQYGRPLGDVHFIASMLSIPCEDRYGTIAMTPQKHKDETLRTLVDLTEAAARRQPSVMLLEDAHWADPTSLEVFDLLIDRVRSIPLLVVVTHRPEFQSRWSQHGHVVALNLSKLTRAQSAMVVSRVAGAKSLPSDLLEQILAKTDGVPLFVEELTKSILESEKLQDAGSGFEYLGSNQIIIPPTLRDSLMARLDRLMPVREIAQIGAAIGREFSYELVAAVTPRPQPQIDEALARLTESGLAFRRGTPPEATYTFKHALVRDAAYDSLLKSHRQELHGRIARAIEERSLSIAQRGPEVLAHHYTQAGQHVNAIPLWKKAGELALGRTALAESISHLNKGLELVATLPASAESDDLELALRVLLGTAWLALGGWPNQELWNSVHPALPLAKSLERNDALLPILWGMTMNVLTQGRVAESFRWVMEMLDAAKATGDPDLLIVGHELAVVYHFFSGRISDALDAKQQVMSLYDDDKHRHLVELLNHDPKTMVGVYGAVSTWMLGYPDRAVRLQEEALAHARRLSHPFDLGFALYLAADVFDCRCEPARQRQLADACDQLGRDNGMPVLSAMLAAPAFAIALIREGRAAEGVLALGDSLKVWEGTGGKVHSSYANAVKAEAMAQSGDLDGALQVIDEQINQVERPGWEERVFYAEMLRLKGWMLSLKGDVEAAERNYLASLAWAREQQAKSWELRTSTSLARLWQARGKSKEAHQLLAQVYSWFTEGFDTKDLKEAKALIEDLR